HGAARCHRSQESATRPARAFPDKSTSPISYGKDPSKGGKTPGTGQFRAATSSQSLSKRPPISIRSLSRAMGFQWNQLQVSSVGERGSRSWSRSSFCSAEQDPRDFAHGHSRSKPGG